MPSRTQSRAVPSASFLEHQHHLCLGVKTQTYGRHCKHRASSCNWPHGMAFHGFENGTPSLVHYIHPFLESFWNYSNWFFLEWADGSGWKFLEADGGRTMQAHRKQNACKTSNSSQLFAGKPGNSCMQLDLHGCAQFWRAWRNRGTKFPRKIVFLIVEVFFVLIVLCFYVPFVFHFICFVSATVLYLLLSSSYCSLFYELQIEQDSRGGFWTQ
jgi:hypothetical protein